MLAAMAVVLLALFYGVLIEPAWQGRQALQRELPTLRSQLAQVLALADEVKALSTVAPVAGGTLAASKAALERSVKAAGMSEALTKLDASGELIDLRFKSVDHAQWLAWLDGALQETRMRVADLAITREAGPGVVSIRLVLEAPRREPRA